MNTKTEPDAGILDALDFEPRCESTLCDHDHAAKWVITLACRHIILLCDHTAARALAIGAIGMAACCPVCRLPVPPVASSPLGHHS